VDDRTVPVDDDERPGWHLTVACQLVQLHVVGCDDLTTPVAEEGKIDPEFTGPGGLREVAIAADRIHLCAERTDFLDSAPQLGQLVRSATGEGEMEEREERDPLGEDLAQRQRLPQCTR